MTDARTAVADFLKEFSATNTPLSGDADIFDSLRISGDDAFEFIERFVSKFEIDATNYHWYFHHGEEPSLNLAACSLSHRIGEWLIFRSHLKFSPKLFAQSDGPRTPTSECALGHSAQSGFLARNVCSVCGQALVGLHTLGSNLEHPRVTVGQSSC
jgi:hypothetical protein